MTITTAEELDALPHSAIVVDSRNFPWQKVDHAETVWLTFGSTIAHTTANMAVWGPFEVLAEGDLSVRRLTGIAVEGA